MASIKVKYRASSVGNHDGAVYYQVIHARKVRQLTTDYRVKPDEWDENRSMVRTNTYGERHSFILSIRERIRWDVDRLTKIVRKFDNEFLVYTVDDVIEEFIRYTRESSLFNYMANLIALLKHNGKTRTAETYMAALNSFKKFRMEHDILLDCLNSEIMESFEAWHRAKGNTPNTISFYTRILRAAYNRAVEEGITDNKNPFRRVYTGVDKTVKRAIPLEAVSRMKSLDLSLKRGLDFARDMFIMSFYLRGMSFIDLAFLKKTDLKNGVLSYRRRKTSQLLHIEWTPEMQRLLDKYPVNTTEYLMPIITRADVNPRNVYRNIGYFINRGLKTIARMIGVAMPLTMYVARHSWASAAKAKGIPVSVISEGMGHDSEATTQIYLASLETSVVDRANSLIIKSI